MARNEYPKLKTLQARQECLLKAFHRAASTLDNIAMFSRDFEFNENTPEGKFIKAIVRQAKEALIEVEIARSAIGGEE